MREGWRWAAVVTALVICAGVAAQASRKAVPVAATIEPPVDLPPNSTRVLRLSPAMVEFGEVQLAERRSVTVQIQNSGNREVMISRVDSPCACIQTRLLRDRIPPSESADLVLTFSGVPGKREYSTSVVVVTDETGPSRYDLPAHGRVIQELVLEPEALQFGKLERGESRTLDSIVRHSGGKPFHVKEVRGGPLGFSFTWDKVDGGYRIRATALGVRPGVLTATALIVMEPSSLPQLPLVLSVEVAGNFTCTPRIASLGFKSIGEDSFVDLLLESRTGGTFDIQSIRDNASRPVEFQEEPSNPGQRKLRLRVMSTLLEGAPVGEFQISVQGEEEAIHVPYRVEIPAPSSKGKQ